MDLQIEGWGLIDYEAALQKQLEYVELRASGAIADTIVFCSHPPVVTLGRATPAADVENWEGSKVEISRGGRATYHGPNQLVFYPIIDLTVPRAGLVVRDIHAYLRLLEGTVVRALKEFAIEGHTRPGKIQNDRGELVDGTGVWVKSRTQTQDPWDSRKIASIGVAIRKWITYHGVAINVKKDHHAFQGIRPCGFSAETMVSMEDLVGNSVDADEVQKVLVSYLKSSLSIEEFKKRPRHFLTGP